VGDEDEMAVRDPLSQLERADADELGAPVGVLGEASLVLDIHPLQNVPGERQPTLAAAAEHAVRLNEGSLPGDGERLSVERLDAVYRVVGDIADPGQLAILLDHGRKEQVAGREGRAVVPA